MSPIFGLISDVIALALIFQAKVLALIIAPILQAE